MIFKTPKFITISAILGISLLTVGCQRVSAPNGHEIVVVSNPIFTLFGNGGINTDPIKSGTTEWQPLTIASYDVPVQPMQYHIALHDFLTSNRVPLAFDAVIRIKVQNSVALIAKFGANWYEQNLEREVLSVARQQVRLYSNDQVALSGEVIDEIDSNILKHLTRYVNSLKMPVEIISFTVGKATPPPDVLQQSVDTAKQLQQVKTEEARKTAEISRKSAEIARADADNAYRNAMGMNPEQYIRLEQIKMQQQVCANNHCTFIIGGNSQPVVQTTTK